jgi:hypothetical protein
VKRTTICGALLLLSLCGCGIPFFRDPGGESVTEDHNDLIAGTEQAVSDALVSPGSAKFSHERVFANQAKHQIIVTGAVDSQNSMGGLMRSAFEDVYVLDAKGGYSRRGTLIQKNTGSTVFF